jgi:DNA-binding Xre family transcriptional regulator
VGGLEMIKCRLKELMKIYEVNQTELSEATGISRPTILSLIKNEAKGIKFDTLDKICKHFNVKINDFLVSDEEIDKTTNQKLDELIDIARNLKMHEEDTIYD